MSSWALGSSTAPAQRGQELLFTHTHTHRMCLRVAERGTSRNTDTNVHKHTHTGQHTLTQTFPRAPTGDRRCHVYCLAGNLHRKEQASRAYHPHVFLFSRFQMHSVFLSDVATSTLWWVYLSKTTTRRALLGSKSKSGGGGGDIFPDEHASGHTLENVNRDCSTNDNK